VSPEDQKRMMLDSSTDRDIWLWLPASISHNQASPWSSPLVLSHWRDYNELHFISGIPPQGPLLSGSGGGGSGGGGNGEPGGGAARPATGVLWPRGVPPVSPKRSTRFERSTRGPNRSP